MAAYQDTPAQQIRNAGQRAALLKRLVKDRALLSVRLPGREGRYTSVLLSVDANKNTLLLDELTPEAGHRLMEEGVEVAVIGRCRGVELRFRCTVQRLEREGDVYGYRCPLPTSLDYYQRRENHRVPVRLSFQHEVSLGGTEEQIGARLTDISTGGLGGVLGDVTAGLQRGERYTCRIQLSDRPPIDVRVEIRFLGRGGVQNQRFGAQFVDLRPGHARQIERLVSELERQALRGE
ncbi:flagellar brake protein [Alkalilimnicola sp. S0819]|uniref:flagellar brake protein n=1 Tax=Alkalilimnicola sp. S0819 TaxID=2613922 RepID=UPI00186A9B45|nr:flagellar brake protein [Alkalilimnicola sp. S0819]